MAKLPISETPRPIQSAGKTKHTNVQTSNSECQAHFQMKEGDTVVKLKSGNIIAT